MPPWVSNDVGLRVLWETSPIWQMYLESIEGHEALQWAAKEVAHKKLYALLMFLFINALSGRVKDLGQLKRLVQELNKTT